jgi:cytochrome P450
LLSSDGVLWEQQRSVLEPEFVGANVAEYADIASDTVESVLERWPERGTVDIHEELSVLTMRVITRSLFSRDTSAERARAVHEALAAQMAAFEPDVRDFLLPEWAQSGPSEAFLAADEQLERVATEFVEWHREQADPPEDMITALMAAQADPEVELSENELVDEAVLFMTGGQETTALTITYALYWLSRHPEHRERLVAEAERVLDGRAPEWADLSELSHTERVVRETLRLTPAAWNITREPREPVEVAGARLDAGETVLLSTYAHHRDSRVWDDPETFRPDRWDGEVSRGVDSYFPFGSGPRVCIGRQIALTEAQFALAHALQEYEIEVLTEELDLRPSITLRPSGPVEARVRARN